MSRLRMLAPWYVRNRRDSTDGGGIYPPPPYLFRVGCSRWLMSLFKRLPFVYWLSRRFLSLREFFSSIFLVQIQKTSTKIHSDIEPEIGSGSTFFIELLPVMEIINDRLIGRNCMRLWEMTAEPVAGIAANIQGPRSTDAKTGNKLSRVL
jgi:hypothetical protein